MDERTAEERLREALAALLRADQEYIHSYDAWLFGPHEAVDQRQLDEAQRRVDDARREAIRWDRLARDVHAARDE